MSKYIFIRLIVLTCSLAKWSLDVEEIRTTESQKGFTQPTKLAYLAIRGILTKIYIDSLF